MLHMALNDEWVQPPVNDMLERILNKNPLVTIHKYPGAKHAFARKGGVPYSQPDAERALDLSVTFFERYLAASPTERTAAE
jgi:carboxymethylenebutenolidase